jgi:hypothetical protein
MIEEQTIGGSNIDLTLQWSNTDQLSFDRQNAGIAHHLSGSNWDYPATYTSSNNVGAGTWTQSRGGITSFSPFIVLDVTIDLPIELLLFEAKRINKQEVQLDWITGSETNNKGFEIERMLDNETSFTNIGWLDGQGTVTYATNYQWIDQNSHRGISYYRLKQINFDGTYSYSPTRVVISYRSGFGGNVNVYPVPATEAIFVDFTDWKQGKETVELAIVDVLGRVLIRQQETIDQNSIILMNGVKDLLPGNYFLMVTTNEGLNFVRKFSRKEGQ